MLSPESCRKLTRAMAEADLTMEQEMEIARAVLRTSTIRELPSWIQSLMRRYG